MRIFYGRDRRLTSLFGDARRRQWEPVKNLSGARDILARFDARALREGAGGTAASGAAAAGAAATGGAAGASAAAETGRDAKRAEALRAFLVPRSPRKVGLTRWAQIVTPGLQRLTQNPYQRSETWSTIWTDPLRFAFERRTRGDITRSKCARAAGTSRG